MTKHENKEPKLEEVRVIQDYDMSKEDGNQDRAHTKTLYFNKGASFALLKQQTSHL
jgi:hypothetical protein